MPTLLVQQASAPTSLQKTPKYLTIHAMITLYKRLSPLCLLILICGLGMSCSTEQSTQPEATVVKPIEQETPAVVKDTIVASEDEVLTWDESADKTKSASEK